MPIASRFLALLSLSPRLRPQPCIPLPFHLVCPTPWCVQLGTLACCPQFCLVSALAASHLRASASSPNTFTEAPVDRLCQQGLALLPEVGFLPSSPAAAPKASVGREGSDFAYKQKSSISSVPLQNVSFPAAKLHVKSKREQRDFHFKQGSRAFPEHLENIWRKRQSCDKITGREA